MKNWNELRSRIPAERRQATDRKVAQAVKDIPLHRLREARRLTQKQLAEAMHIDQSRVSKIERRTDVYVSTLKNFVAALGGELELVAASGSRASLTRRSEPLKNSPACLLRGMKSINHSAS